MTVDKNPSVWYNQNRLCHGHPSVTSYITNITYTEHDMGKRTSRTIPRVLSVTQKWHELRGLVNLCLIIIDEDDAREVANRTGLSVSTIRRLAMGEYTLRVQFRTVQALCLAAGISFDTETGRVKVRQV